ncbi:UDP-2-acetamido-2,6-beta-L-arabino-hexul-4-ose reductase [Massilia sp. GCM10023247]|uniref:UDP-2-acetamido-2,6-beta-L-arabino-hexul-4-ose reductase n=1 Tax=Massilia sp. GCM10023247 TaxID=3252643 RepID=UPI003617AD2E
MRIVITGADGFIGKNLGVRLAELGHKDVVGITRATPETALQDALRTADFVFHVAGVNRPLDPSEFADGNAGLTATVCTALAAAGRKATVVLTSSTQATSDNPYGASKLGAEDAVRTYATATGAVAHVFRLPNVFGKWARPNYNSAVATFCHNIARGLDISVRDPAAPLHLVYIDDVLKAFVACLPTESAPAPAATPQLEPVYNTTVGEVAEALRGFASSRTSLVSPRVGTGLTRALYSTYISYLPPELFAYEVPMYTDPRGTFVEMLKTPDCGQFSFFTAAPGVTRGEHYHHTKTEKFLVIRGTAHFGFRQIATGEYYELTSSGAKAEIVETVPGWTHNITNVGEDELIVMLWANEIFDRQNPDTIAMKVKQ